MDYSADQAGTDQRSPRWKIFVYPVSEVIRIRTGESGQTAV